MEETHRTAVLVCKKPLPVGILITCNLTACLCVPAPFTGSQPRLHAESPSEAPWLGSAPESVNKSEVRSAGRLLMTTLRHY